MNKKNTFKQTAALLFSLAIAVGATGCNFFPTDTEKDLAQTVATVNVAETMKATDATTAAQVEELVKLMNDGNAAQISKRELVAYYLSVGYQYVDSYGYTYEDTFNMLLDGLINREIMTQYAISYYLKNLDGVDAAGCKAYVQEEPSKATGKEKELLEAHPEVLVFKYFLTEGNKAGETKAYDSAIYNLKKSLNDSLDSLEAEFIKTSSEEHNHAEARTLPTNAGTEKSDYYALPDDYGVYTGRNTLDSCGEYEKVEGSTSYSRKSAYNSFLANLQRNGLLQTSGKVENHSDITKLDYYYVQLGSSLGQALINKYYEDVAEEVIDGLTAEYVGAEYEKRYQEDKRKYENNLSTFETAIDGLSDTSFVLYGHEGYGFVYNILLPFSTTQNIKYSEAKARGLTDDELFNVRKELASDIKGKDLRDTWFSMHDHANYSYVGEDGKYYFFEGNFTNERKYEKLTQYAGSYAFNGTVTEDKDKDEYVCEATEISIDQFLNEFETHINKVSGATASGNVLSTYEVGKYDTVYTINEEVQYDKFMYYQGKVDVGTVNAADYFKADSTAYKAVSAVNELMFAYSTDTGCLNKYMGYSVSPYGTNFVPEFEYAAQEAVKGGVGTYTVCATDYGWHIVYCSFVYGAADANGDNYVYGAYNHAEAVGETKVEGSFSNLFYESLKSSAASKYSSEKESDVLNTYNVEGSVTRYQETYQDLLDMDK